MQDLTLVGMHEDGERLLLSTASGERFTLAVDEALRVAVRGDRPRLSQLQLETERMRPRDIQARIRAGQSAEEVAAAGEVPLEYVQRYEGPVLAERSYVASQARKVQIRRGALAAATSPTLGDLVVERLRRREVDPDLTVWDAWRAEDGSWIVTLTFRVGAKERTARWGYDAALRQVTPLDDESRWLTDGDGREGRQGRRVLDARTAAERATSSRPAADHVDEPSEGHHRQEGARRLALARDPRAEADLDDLDEADLLDALVEQDMDLDQLPAGAPSLELLDSLRERRGRRVRPVPPDEDEQPDPVETAIESILASRAGRQERHDPEPVETPPSGGRATTRSESQAARPDGQGSRHPAGKALPRNGTPGRGRSTTTTRKPTTNRTVDVPAPSPPPAERTPSPAAPSSSTSGRGRTRREPDPEPDRDPTPETDEGTRTAPARKSRRASVPSWDEIILGARRD